MEKKNEKFLLVSVFGSITKIVKEGHIAIIQAEKSKLKKLPQWRKFIFQVRTPEGYKAVKILMEKGKVKQ